MVRISDCALRVCDVYASYVAFGASIAVVDANEALYFYGPHILSTFGQLSSILPIACSTLLLFKVC